MSFEKFIEKARREPKKYKDLLIEEKKSFEGDLRSYYSWTFVMINILIGLVTLYTKLRVSLLISLLGISSIYVITLIFILKVLSLEKKILRIREILYGDPMELSNGKIAIIMGVIATIITIVGITLILFP